MLAGIRSPEGLCLNLFDAPEAVRAAGRHAAHAYVQGYNRCHGILREAGQGSTTWCTLWHDGPAYVSSCDFLGLVTREAAEHFIRPTLVIEPGRLAQRRYDALARTALSLIRLHQSPVFVELSVLLAAIATQKHR